MKKLFFTFLFLIAFSGCTKSQEPVNVINNFFFAYKNDKINDGLKNLFGTNPYINVGEKEINNVYEKLNIDIKQIGKYQGYELIAEKKVGNSLIHYTYLVKHETQPLRFVFIFYKANDSWSLYKFSYDANLITEIEETAKFYYLE